ncbi:MAG: box helicase-like protein, partial [Segetibacter sp.]|nr:box helicase-like protein [Segetibacter sp.]
MKQATANIEKNIIAFLIEYNQTDVKKGLRLYQQKGAEISGFDEKLNEYDVVVPSESDDYTEYFVTLSFTKHAVETYCECPSYEDKGTCKHIAAAAIEILWMEGDLEMKEIEKLLEGINGKESSAEATPFSATAKVVSLFNDIDTGLNWHSFISNPQRAFTDAYLKSGYGNTSQGAMTKIKLVTENREVPSWQFQFGSDAKTVYLPEIRYDRNIKLEYRCTCNLRAIMCIHVKAGFDLLENKHGRDFFTQFKDWTKEKAKLLEEYGLKPDDKEVENIKFTSDYYGNLTMSAPSWIWGKNADVNIQNFRKLLAFNNEQYTSIERPKITKEAIIDFQVGFLFNLLSQHFKLRFELEVIKVFDKPKGKQFKKLSVHQPANLALLKELPDDIYSLTISISDEGVKKYLSQNGHGQVMNYSNPWQQMSDATTMALRNYYISQLFKLWPHLCSHPDVYLLKEGSFSNKNIQPANLSPDFVSFKFIVKEDERFITIWQILVLKGEEVTSDRIHIYEGFLFIIDDVLHLPADIKDLDIIKQFQHGFIKIPVTNKLQVIRQIIPALQKKYEVELPLSLQLHTLNPEPKPQILLKEYETKYLMLQPQFQYEEVTVDYESGAQDILQTLPDGTWQVYMRHEAKERSFFESIRALHPFFQRQKQNDFFFLPFDDV